MGALLVAVIALLLGYSQLHPFGPLLRVVANSAPLLTDPRKQAHLFNSTMGAMLLVLAASFLL